MFQTWVVTAQNIVTETYKGIILVAPMIYNNNKNNKRNNLEDFFKKLEKHRNRIENENHASWVNLGRSLSVS